MEESNLTIDEDILDAKTSRAVTFTLSSSSSLSSLCLQQDNQQEEYPLITMFNTQTAAHRSLTHSQSLTLECQRRRPVIEDPYQLAPNLEILNDWMIVS